MNIGTTLAEGFVKQVLEEKLTSMGMLKDNEEIVLDKPVPIRLIKKNKEEEVYSLVHEEPTT